MANVCAYHIRVKGTKRNCYAFMYSTNIYNDQYIDSEYGTDKNYTLLFNGDCKWSIDSYCRGGDVDISDMPDFNELESWDKIDELRNLDLQSKSRVLNVDIWCCTKIEAGLYPEDYEKYHYTNGISKSNRRPPADIVFEKEYENVSIQKYFVIIDTKGGGSKIEISRFDNEADAEAYTNKLNENEHYRYAYYEKEEEIHDDWW